MFEHPIISGVVVAIVTSSIVWVASAIWRRWGWTAVVTHVFKEHGGVSLDGSDWELVEDAAEKYSQREKISFKQTGSRLAGVYEVIDKEGGSVAKRMNLIGKIENRIVSFYAATSDSSRLGYIAGVGQLNEDGSEITGKVSFWVTDDVGGDEEYEGEDAYDDDDNFASIHVRYKKLK